MSAPKRTGAGQGGLPHVDGRGLLHRVHEHLRRAAPARAPAVRDGRLAPPARALGARGRGEALLGFRVQGSGFRVRVL